VPALRTLTLMRHAKSSWEDATLGDFDRPLNARGLAAVPKMAAFLEKTLSPPDRVLCSPARRTRETYELLTQHGILLPSCEFPGSLYLASRETLQEILCQVPDSVSSVLIIGHNPGLADFFAELAGHTEKFPTAAVASFDLELSRWSELRRKFPCRLAVYQTPKRL